MTSNNAEKAGADSSERTWLRSRTAGRASGGAAATVLRGLMGFGRSSRLHTAKISRLSMDLPLVIEFVDTEEKIQQLLP
jgi:PII-like signaling protein